MTVLTFPYSDPNNYAYHEGVSRGMGYFPIRDMKGDQTGSKIQILPSESNIVYSKLRYIDLDQSLDGESQPFIDSLRPFTMEITIKMEFDGGDSDTYFSKNRTFFSIGQYVAGKPGGVITVGTDSTGANKKKPVLGIIDQNGAKKSEFDNSSALDILEEIEYTFRLIFDPFTNDSYKIALFLKKDIDIVECLQSNGEGLSINYNYNITKPRLYLFTSGWTNEDGWDGAYDYTYGIIGERQVRVHDVLIYPTDFILERLTRVNFDSAPILSEIVSNQYILQFYTST